MPGRFSTRSRGGTYKQKKGDKAKRQARSAGRGARRRTGARAQSRQIVQLSKAVSSLAERMPGQDYTLSQGLYHRLTDYSLGSTTANTGLSVIPLLPCLEVGGPFLPNWRAWGPGLSGSLLLSGNERLQTFTPAARQGHINLQMKFDVGTENDGPINFTVAVVTLHKDIAADMVKNFGYDMQLFPTLTQNEADQYFCRGAAGSSGRPSTAGLITFAPDKFKVLKKTQFSLTSAVPTASTVGLPQVAATVPSASENLIQWKIPCGYTINPKRMEPWADVEPDLDYVPPHNVRYLIIANDNRATDLELCYMNLFASTMVSGLM